MTDFINNNEPHEGEEEIRPTEHRRPKTKVRQGHTKGKKRQEAENCLLSEVIWAELAPLLLHGH